MTATGSRGVARVLAGQPATDGAGVRMTRVIATEQLDHFDPFLLLDEFRSDDPGDYIAGFPDHPHRGFETVTYMLAGAMKHGDNKGNTGLLGPGSVQWMTAGRGIVHSEMPQQEDGLMWGFQLWVNLPAKDKMTAPRYQDIPAGDVPAVELDAGTVRVIAGSFGEARGPVRDVVTEPVYLDVELKPGKTLDVPLPDSHNAFAYCFGGSVDIGGTTVERAQLALLSAGERCGLAAGEEGGRCLVVAALPLGEPVARYGPFVMNTPDELRQAFVDFQSGNF
jgi:redox-sensitive bicupin YhaK (pirin superfamily)